MEYYRALKVIGKAPVRFISFPNEGHGPRKLSHMRRKLKEEDQLNPVGDNLVFGLGGNAAEWVDMGNNEGKRCGGSADTSADPRFSDKPSDIYTGFRIVFDNSSQNGECIKH